MPRERTARAAVLGSSVQRAAASAYPSRSRSVLRRRAVLGGLVLLSLVLITLSFRNSRALGHAEGVGANEITRVFTGRKSCGNRGESW